MVRFFKAQASSVTATVFDFSTTIVLKELLKWRYLPASITGTVVGGLCNFFVNRHLVFDATHRQAHHQFVKYLLVWAGSMLLNAAGMYLMSSYFANGYVLSKIIVSLAIGLGYNYFLQKKFVFK